MTRWIVLVVAAALAGCGGTEGAGGEPSPVDVGAGPDVTPATPCADAAPPEAAARVVRCGTSLIICEDADGGLVCVDAKDDSANCGFCGLRCATGQACSAGVCR